MSTEFDLAIEPLEDLDAPAFSDFEAGVAIGLAIVGLAVAVAT
jgi:hypothetical protein